MGALNIAEPESLYILPSPVTPDGEFVCGKFRGYGDEPRRDARSAPRQCSGVDETAAVSCAQWKENAD